MKFTEETVGGRKEFLASAKFLAINHTFEQDTKSGAEVAVTDGLGRTNYGFCLYDVNVNENPNGAVVVQGIISVSKLPEEPSTAAKAAMFPTLIFVD